MKNRQDDVEVRMARKLLEKAGFEVKRVAVDPRHRLRGDVKPKEIEQACRWLLENESGCVHYDMFRFGGRTYSVCLGMWGEDDDYGVYCKVASQPCNSVMQCGFDIDWEMPVVVEGKEEGMAYDTLFQVVSKSAEKGIDYLTFDADASEANRLVLEVYKAVADEGGWK